MNLTIKMKMKLLPLVLAALAAISNAYGQNRGVAYVDTLAVLDAMRPIPGMTVYVRGASAVYDWGNTPLPFSYVSGSTSPTNEYCRPTALGTGRWIHDFQGGTGIRYVDSIAERDAIPYSQRIDGMMVYIQGTDPSMYRLDAGLSSWTEIPLITSSAWSAVSSLPTQAEVFQKVSTYAVPLTVRQSSSDILVGFVRNADAFDPIRGSHVSSNTLRAFALPFGAVSSLATLIERVGTNFAFPGFPAGQLNPVRMTVTTNVTAGPFGMDIPAISYTDTDITNSHYIYFNQGPANSAPVQFGILFKPLNSTNNIFDLQLAVDTNFAWNCDIKATLDGSTLLPTVTRTTAGPVTFHDGGFVRLDRGWYYSWMNITLTNAPVTRAFFGANIGLATKGITNYPSFYTAAYNYSSTPTALETPIYPLSKTNGTQILNKPQDAYNYTILRPIKGGEGSLLLWLKNGFKQPTNATLIESGSFRVEMTRSALNINMPDQGAGVSLSSTIPELMPTSERLVTLTWNTNGLRAFIDGSLVGASSAPSGVFSFSSTGTIGRAAADTNHWNGHIAAAYLGTTLSDAEVSYLPKIVGPSSNLSTFESLASRTQTDIEAPIPLSEVVWSPRFIGDGNYPYNATNKAREFFATASMWMYIDGRESRLSGLRAVTPTLGATFNPSLTQDTSALEIDYNTGQNIKPTWYVNANVWHGCANRPVYRQAIVDTLAAYYNLGIRHIQHDDPAINYILALPYLQYLYGTGSALGTLGAVSYGCVCPSCVADASANGYGALTTTNLRAYQTQTTINYWQWLGGAVRSNVDLKISANLSPTTAIYADGYTPGRFHYPLIEVTLTNTYPDKLISDWVAFKGKPLIGTYTVNTLTNYEDNFGPTDRTRRWMAGSYAIGFLPVLPWDVYNGNPVIRTYAGRASIVDISGFVRAQGDHLLRGYSLSGAVGQNTYIPADKTVAAWASTNQVLVTVRYRPSDGRRVIHCVDFRDTPAAFTLSWWKPIVGGSSATTYYPSVYNQTVQDAAVASGDLLPLSTSSNLTISLTNSVASVTMPAKMWQIVEVLE